MPEQNETGFKVTDRRKFNPDGSPRDSTAPEPEPGGAESRGASKRDNVVSFPVESQAEPKQAVASAASGAEQATTATSSGPSDERAAQQQQAERAYEQHRGPAQPNLPEASFVGLVNMLAIESELALGLIVSPGQEAPEVNLEAARHLVDILGMLQAKTRGNLTPQEQNLLDEVLAYLRMQFVRVSSGR